MKKTLFAIAAFAALALGTNSFAACPCSSDPSPCDMPHNNCYEQQKPCDTPCNPCKENLGCSEDWLSYSNLQEYFCQMGFTDCQKEEAMNAIEEFKCKTQALRNNDCTCETKCDCRTYRHALKDLDCKMKHIVTQCQKDEYKEVRRAVKEQVKCAHKCLINPFSSCKCACGK